MSLMHVTVEQSRAMQRYNEQVESSQASIVPKTQDRYYLPLQQAICCKESTKPA
jgi:hypothetical protein